MQNAYQNIIVQEKSKHVILLTFNRPEVANAFNTEMAVEITHFFESVSSIISDTRVIVITGSGEKAFCAGGDLKERNGMSDDKWQSQHLIFERMIRSIINCPIPIIGAINGAAYGGGCELAAALDFIYVAENAKFAQTEVNLGIIPGIGGTQNLSRAIGEKKAKELIFTGAVFSATQAYEWGLANKIFPLKILLDKTLDAAKLISEKGPIAIKQAKIAINKGIQMSLLDGMAFEIEAYNRTISTEDRKEGIKAFNEKRKPDFIGK